MSSRQAERIRKVILVAAAIALLATSGLSRKSSAAPIPGAAAKGPANSEPILVLPPPPVPELGPAAPPASAPGKAPVAAPKPAVTPKTSAAPPTKMVPVMPASPVSPKTAPAPVAAPPEVIPVAPPAPVPPAPQTANGEWKILIRPEFYKANDPWEYVRTGGISWTNGAAGTAPHPSSSAAVTGDSAPPVMAGPQAPVAAASGYPCSPWGYKAAYAAIPFSRTEYEANPAYRHEAAMELLFGQLRPTTIVKQTQPYFSRYPDMFRYRHAVYPYLAPGSNTVDLNYYWNYPGYW